MLTILGRDSNERRFCDGMSRRSFLTIGSLAGGICLPNLLRAEAAQGRRSHKALINVFLPGGPPHQDMWDLKPDAASEVRGEFNPIPTNVPGIQVCELFPRLAAMMDKLVIVRSIVGARGPHYATQCMTGRPENGSPSLGAWVSHLEGPTHRDMPPHLSLCYRTQHKPWGEPGGGGFLGETHGPFALVDSYDPGHKAENTSQLAPQPGELQLRGVTINRASDRRTLLKRLDTFRRRIESDQFAVNRDQFAEQAWGILTSSRLIDALDVSQEDPKIRERYGEGNPQYNADSAPRVTQNLLVARRLVEAGARVVSLNFSRWDWHGNNFKQGRSEFPLLDNSVSALVEDLHQRGLDQDVTVIVWGEFGRTPMINKGAGRDHWPRVNSALLAGGGMRTGQVIGATDKSAGEVVSRPVTFPDIHATLYHNLGINPHLSVPDRQGRVQHPVDIKAQPLAELV